MRLLELFLKKKTKTSSIAKERLQIVVSHQNNNDDSPVFVQNLKDELIRVIAKYTNVEDNQVQVNLQGSILELNVDLSTEELKEGA